MTTVTFPSTSFSSQPVEDFLLGMRLSMSQGREIQPVELFKLFNVEKYKVVLVGGHAVNARTGRPRATVDVDLVAEKPKKVAELIQQNYPHLHIEDHPVVLRFKDGQNEAIDIIKPESDSLFKRILKCTERLEVNGVMLTIPDLEAMLALKFASMISLTRKIEDKYTDGRDFILIAKGATKIDNGKLSELGTLVYAEGGKDLLQLVADARAGKKLNI